MHTSPLTGHQSQARGTGRIRGEKGQPRVAAKASAKPRPVAIARRSGRVTMKQILAIAALPSSKRIVGWRTPAFDKQKAFVTQVFETNPSTPLKPLLDLKADIGPELHEIPPLPDALERVGALFAKQRAKMDIERVEHLPTEVLDYVIIGCGMAGAAAGSVIADANRAGAGLKGIVLEGSDVVGGRARDVEIDGKMAGLGPSWLHGRYNMLRRMADLLGLTRQSTHLDRMVFENGTRLSKEKEDGLFSEEERAEDAMLKAANRGAEDPRHAASKFFPPGRWKGVAMAEMGRGDQGMNIGQVDIEDGARFQSNDDDFIKEGMQEFVTRLAKAAELKVSFNSVLKEADRDANGVWTLKLKDGRTVKTKQVIYTGSTAALSNIDFKDKLPRAKLEAAHAMPMGNFTKFLFTTKQKFARPDTLRNSWVVNAVTDKSTGKLEEQEQFVVDYEGDHSMNIMFTDAKKAKDAIALGLLGQKKLIGEKFSPIAGEHIDVDQVAHTPFASDPLFGGSYSNLLPGMEGAHTVYAAPFHGFNFAGEAAGTAQNNASLLAAFTSGIDSAYDVIAALLLRNKRAR
jgi:predicted NAD/FAD-dependent oxidoreductase